MTIARQRCARSSGIVNFFDDDTRKTRTFFPQFRDSLRRECARFVVESMGPGEMSELV
jgi:hypothetical protein